MPASAPPSSPPMREVAPEQEKPVSSSADTTTTNETTSSSASSPAPPQIVLPDDFRTAIKAADCGDSLAMKWSSRRKWLALTIIFLVQVSMNLNTTLYSNGISAISHEYGVSPFAVRWGGAASFLIAYAFGCELWAPWSEEYGRWRVLQASLFLVNCWAILVALALSWAAHVVGRVLGGLSSAGGSVTLAMVSDMFANDDPLFQHATSFIVLSSVGGSIIGPIIGGFIEKYCAWRWCIWVQVIFGFFVQVLHFCFVKETRAPVIMDKVAKSRRKSGQNPYLFGPNEMSEKSRITAKAKEVAQIWYRPFQMFVKEPIVLCLSLLSGFSDALIFMMVQCFGFVYWQWGFNSIELGLSFIPIGLGYLIGASIFYFFIQRNVHAREKNPASEEAQYESRLKPLLYLGPLLPMGLLVFAFTAAWSETPIHWIFSMIASCMIGIANYAIYMATIDYVLRAYGPYSASATGGNGFARDFLAGILTPYAIPMYVYHSYLMYEKMTIFMATILLLAIAIVLYGAVLIVFWKGPWLRRHSKFAQDIAEAAEDEDSAAAAIADADDRGPHSSTGRGGASLNHQLLFLRAESLPGSRAASAATSPVTSARNSLHLSRPQAARQVSEASHVSLNRPRVGQRQVSEASHASLNRPQVSQRQVSESSYVNSLSRPPVGQRQTSATSVTPSRRHHKRPENPEQPVLAEDIWDAAERHRAVVRANAAHAKDCAKANGSCMCVGKNIAGCNCGKGAKEETQRNSDPTSVNEVEDAPGAPARARAHVHFREEVSEVSAPDISERTESERGEVRDDCIMM